VNDTVYVGSNDNTVYALNATNGSERWNVTTGSNVSASPAVANDTVFIGSQDGNVYALNATDGSQRWSFSADDMVVSAPAVVNDTVYVGSQVTGPPVDGNLYAINESTGSKRWDVSTGPVSASPAVANNTVYVDGTSSNVTAINATDGAIRWNFTTMGAVVASPGVVDDTVHIGSSDDKVYGVNATDGSKRWGFRTGDSVSSSPAVTDGTVYIGSDDNRVYALREPQPGTVTGTVTNASGSGLSGISVAVEDQNRNIVNQTTTDASGDYSLEVSAGTYAVIANDTSDEHEDAFEVISVSEGGTLQEDLTMQEAPGIGTIQGTVVNASNTSETIGAASIKVADSEFANFNDTTSASDGTFSMQVPAGTYRLRASQGNFAPDRISNIEVTENDTTQVTVELAEPAKLNGTVTNASGPVSKVPVIIADQDSNERFFAPADGSGDYSKNLPPGEYSITAFKQGEVATGETVSIASGENETVDISLKKASVNHSSVEVVNPAGVDTGNISVFAKIGPGIMLVQLINDNTKTQPGMPNDLESLGVDADTEFVINVTAKNYTANSLQWGARNVSWDTTNNATVDNGTDITVRTQALNLQGVDDNQLPIGPLMDKSPADINWPSGAKDRADLGWNRTVYFGLFDLATAPPQIRQNLQGVTVTTNGQTFSPPEVDGDSLEVWVAGPSTTVEGNDHDGFYRAFIPDAQLTAWGVDDPTQGLNTLYKGDSANFTVDETDDGPDGRSGAWIELQNISYSAGEINVTADPQPDTTDDSSDDGGTTSSASRRQPRVIETPEEIEEVIENPPTDVQPRRAEQAQIAIDEADGQARVTFTEESTTESITFEDTGVEGEVTVAEYDSEPDEIGPSPGRSAVVTQIEVPDPEQPATLRERVSTDRLEEIDANAEDLRINRFNDEAGEWQALETETVEHTDEWLVLEAETPGFSFFSVSAVSEPEAVITAPVDVEVDERFTLEATESTDEYGEIVSHEWTVAGETLSGESVTTAVDTTGDATVELTVTNDAGETTTETATITVSDGEERDDDGADKADSTSDGQADGTDEVDETDEADDLDGFGIVVTLVALLAAALVAQRRV
jgi:PGF-pre-PGF domain-containing protein/PGF-CTERM protein